MPERIRGPEPRPPSRPRTRLLQGACSSEAAGEQCGFVDPRRLADELGIDPRVLRAWLRRQYPRETPGAPWLLTADQIHAARARWYATAPQRRTAQPDASRAKPNTRDEAYVVDLLEELLGEPASRQHTFDWLVGDPGRWPPSTPARRRVLAPTRASRGVPRNGSTMSRSLTSTSPIDTLSVVSIVACSARSTIDAATS